VIKKLSFALFDTGETILGALVFSTIFPLYITQHIDTKLYSFLYGLSFLLSFGLALYLGKLADRRAIRKHLFVLFGALVGLSCIALAPSLPYPYLALTIFLGMAILHQQAFVFYNSLLLNFESKGFTSGLGVAFGYVGSALALIFLAKYLKGEWAYIVVGVLFLALLLPSAVSLENPAHRGRVSLMRVLRDKRFLLLIVSILTVTEVANTLIAMMGVYLREVFSMESQEIYRVIGMSAIGGIAGGIFWGKLTDILGVERVFPFGFILWMLFLSTLYFAPENLIVLWGFLGGLSLSHVWTTSRVLVLKKFPHSEASVRLSFLSLTERVASTTGLFVWSFFLLITGNNFRLSATLMLVFPVLGFFLYRYIIGRLDEGSYG